MDDPVARRWWAILALGFSTSACASAPPLRLSAWTVEWREVYVAGALQALDAPAPGLAEISHFRLHFDAAGEVVASGSAASEIFARARRRGLRQLVTLVNDVVDASGVPLARKDPDVVHAILADPVRRAHLVETLCAAVIAGGYDGLDLDLENLYAKDRERLSELVAALGAALRARQLSLAVTVHPQLRPEGRAGPGAQDLATLARHADEIRVMAYHVHHDGTPPGPSAPRQWLEDLISYMTSQVEASRITLALYAGGWKWEGGRATQLSHREALAAAQELGAAPQWSEQERQPYFNAVTARGPVSAWYEDRCSLLDKSRLAAAHGLRGVALWHLGNADAALFAVLPAVACVRPER